jgi:hypothetical protein
MFVRRWMIRESCQRTQSELEDAFKKVFSDVYGFGQGLTNAMDEIDQVVVKLARRGIDHRVIYLALLNSVSSVEHQTRREWGQETTKAIKSLEEAAASKALKHEITF